MIRIDSIWLATEPMDMRAGTETALARVVAVFGAAKPHCAYASPPVMNQAARSLLGIQASVLTHI
ncbi:hypothetical protein IFR09_11590 [Pseudomonas syringae]|nr:hypothetical protein [Pseudomonas syringae]MBD8801846.1 hypothetical protein [Pseudomonas syringae]MBD8811804.1 hypothetical protein [Pseudomonas syringae]